MSEQDDADAAMTPEEEAEADAEEAKEKEAQREANGDTDKTRGEEAGEGTPDQQAEEGDGGEQHDEGTKAEAGGPAVAVPQAVAPDPGLSMGGEISPIIPKNLDDLAQMATAFIRAGMVPDSLIATVNNIRGGPMDNDGTKAKVMLVIAKGMEVKIPPMQAVANIYVVGAKPTIFGDLGRMLVMRSGECEGWNEFFEIDGEVVGETVEIDDAYTAVCELKRKGWDKLWEGRFSCAQAKKAGLWMNPKKKPWMDYPVQMLMWRARTFAMRAGFSDVLGGLALAEEMQDVTPDDKSVDAKFLNE